MKLSNLVDFSKVTNWVSTQIASSKASENKLVSQVAQLVFSKWAPFAVGVGCVAWAVRNYNKTCNFYEDGRAITLSSIRGINEARQLIISSKPEDQQLGDDTLIGAIEQEDSEELKEAKRLFLDANVDTVGKIIQGLPKLSEISFWVKVKNTEGLKLPTILAVSSFAVAAFVARRVNV